MAVFRRHEAVGLPTEYMDLTAENRQLANEVFRAQVEKDEALAQLEEARSLADFNGRALEEMTVLRTFVKDIADPPLRAWQMRTWKP